MAEPLTPNNTRIATLLEALDAAREREQKLVLKLERCQRIEEKAARVLECLKQCRTPESTEALHAAALELRDALKQP